MADIYISITSAEIDNISSTLTVKGTSEGAQTSENFPFTLVIVDTEGLKVFTRVVAHEDGSFTFSNIDVSTLADGKFTIYVQGYNSLNEFIETEYTGTAVIKDTFDPSINTVPTVDNDNAQVDLVGTSTDLDDGTEVTITITDTEGNSVVVTTTVDVDGRYAIDDVDVSSLTDGELTIDTKATDAKGNPVVDKDTVILDAVSSKIDTIVENVDHNNKQIDLTGSSQDVPSDAEVIITITDREGNVVTVTTTTDANGNYAINDIDISSLVDGNLTVDTKAIDNNGKLVTDRDPTELKSFTVGSIDTIPTWGQPEPIVDPTDPWQQQEQQNPWQQQCGQQQQCEVTTDENGNTVINIFGTSKDISYGGEVTLTLVDSQSNTVIVKTTVDAQGDYSVKGIDASKFVEGTITIYTSAVDNHGNTVTDVDYLNKEADLDPSINSQFTVYDNSCGATAYITGTTEDLAPNTTVMLRIYDEAGRYMTRYVTTDANGNYALKGLDISALYDGNLRLETSAIAKDGTKVADTDYAEKDTAYDRYVNLVGLDHAVMSNDLTVAYTAPYGQYARYSYQWDHTTNPYRGYMTDNNHDHINISGHITNRSTLNTFGGDDVVRIGYNIDTSTVNLGSGDNTLIVGTSPCADGYITVSTVTAGAGDDFVSVKSNIACSVIDLGEGDNTIVAGNYITGSSTQILTGAGDDVLKVGTNVDGATVSLGNGDNEIYVGGYVTHTAITTGAGEDTIVIKGSVLNYALINTGAGNDDISIGSLDSHAKINGGAGEDTLHFTLTDKDISFSSILNVENIELGTGTQYLKDVTYKNMVNAGVSELHIDGDSKDWVYLGTSNNNTVDTSAGRYASWVQTGTTNENGTSYDVYTYSADSDVKVYVEQSVNVY